MRGTGLPSTSNHVEERGREEHYSQRPHQERFTLFTPTLLREEPNGDLWPFTHWMKVIYP